MKKLTLLTISLLCASIAHANIILEATFKKGELELVTTPVILTADNATIEYNIADEIYKVVLTKFVDNQDECETHLDVFLTKDNVDTLVMQPCLHGLPATLTVGNDEESISFTINKAE